MQIIAVAGASGSGKTTVAEELHKYYGSDCVIISSDNYYKDLSHLSSEERAQVNFDHPDSIDFELLQSHLALLKQGECVEMPTYDFKTHTRTKEVVIIVPTQIAIVEGILTQYSKSLMSLYDTTIFVDTDQTICFKRRLERDIHQRGRNKLEVTTQYYKHVKPMYEEYVAPCKARADIIIENNIEYAKTPEGLNFDLTELFDYLSREEESSRQRENIFKTQQRFTLFSKSPANTELPAALNLIEMEENTGNQERKYY